MRLDEQFLLDFEPSRSVDLSDLKIIFVVGSVRSGTSVVGQALNHVLGKGRGFFEGNAIGLLTAVTDAVDRYYENFRQLQPSVDSHLSRFPKDWIKAALQQYVIAEIAEPIFAHSEGVWIDKSPDGSYRAERVRACAALARAFPRAKFVFCRRSGVENVASRIRKWGADGFITHCHGWAGVMAAWESLRPLLAGRYVEIDQYKISTEPAEAADSLALTLSMSEAERDAIATYFREQTPERTSETHERPRPLAAIDWRLIQKWIFLAICSPGMERFRYELGEAPAAHASAPILTLRHPKIRCERLHVDPWQVGEFPGGFELRPAAKGRPAPLLRFLSVPAWKKMRLRGALVHGACEGAGVHYHIRIYEAEGKEIFAQRFIVGPGDAYELDEPLRCDAPSVHVEVWTKLADDGPDWRTEPPERALKEAPDWLRPPAWARARVAGLSCAPEADLYEDWKASTSDAPEANQIVSTPDIASVPETPEANANSLASEALETNESGPVPDIRSAPDAPAASECALASNAPEADESVPMREKDPD